LAALQWLTLPFAAAAFGRRTDWWTPLVVGVLLRQVVTPAMQRIVAPKVRSTVLALAARGALLHGAFEAEPTSLAPTVQRIEHAATHALATFVGSIVSVLGFAVVATASFSPRWSFATLVCASLALAVRWRARSWVRASGDTLLDAVRAESRWLLAAATGRWELTGSAHDRFIAKAHNLAAQTAAAEAAHAARERVLRSAQVALVLAPFAVTLTLRARAGVAPTAHDLVAVLPVLAPALAAFRSLDTIGLAVRALARVDASATATRNGPWPDTPTAMELRDVSVRYGDHLALDAVTATLAPRGVTAVVGPNGAGKSTLARVLAGAVRPSGGSCCVGGHDVCTLTPEGVSLVPQTPCLIEGETVGENLRLVALDADDVTLRETLEALGLPVLLTHPLGRLSRGAQRRVAIARAGLCAPRWLILDEPDAWLDADGRQALQRWLREHARNRAVVIVTHRADLVAWTDHVIVLSAAHRIEAEGPPHEALQASATGRALLASMADEAQRFSEGPHTGWPHG
jgi:ABC-type multidrug transport system ATPase subunit